MAFVNECISEDDVKKFGIEEIDRQFLKLTFQPHWTVDHEKNIYLRQVAAGREEFSEEKKYTLFFKNTLLIVDLNERGGGVRGAEGWSEYKLLKMDLPNELVSEKAEIISILKDALTAFKGGGVHSTRATTKTTFNF